MSTQLYATCEPGGWDEVAGDDRDAAAREYAEEWRDTTMATELVNVIICRMEDDEPADLTYHKIILDPAEPGCVEDEHDWQTHREVWGHGGGVRWSDRCCHCGLIRETDTWATDYYDGTQGHTIVEYKYSDDEE